jgi:tetratricopeptide (TPR) repeat protein
MTKVEQELWAKIYAAAYVEPKGPWAVTEKWRYGIAERRATEAADNAVAALRKRVADERAAADARDAAYKTAQTKAILLYGAGRYAEADEAFKRAAELCPTGDESRDDESQDDE